jgi:hypothetical protein
MFAVFVGFFFTVRTSKAGGECGESQREEHAFIENWSSNTKSLHLSKNEPICLFYRGDDRPELALRFFIRSPDRVHHDGDKHQ